MVLRIAHGFVQATHIVGEDREGLEEVWVAAGSGLWVCGGRKRWGPSRVVVGLKEVG